MLWSGLNPKLQVLTHRHSQRVPAAVVPHQHIEGGGVVQVHSSISPQRTPEPWDIRDVIADRHWAVTGGQAEGSALSLDGRGWAAVASAGGRDGALPGIWDVLSDVSPLDCPVLGYLL